MKVGDCKPALLLVEKREPAIEENIGGDECLIRRESGHRAVRGRGNYRLRELASIPIGRAFRMAKNLRLIFIAVLGLFFASCATQPTPTASTATRGRVQKVRTTAYTHTERGGSRNAIGQRLSCGRLKSASADWSRFPLGTHFRVMSSGDEYIIDDYGGALVGTSTIDLYKSSRGEMHRWGVRHEDIQVIHWGSDEDSLKVLRQRKGVGRVRRMIASLEKKPHA
jgi:3D (Asp-Asp-Asp) domain-containing protein